MCLIVFAWRRHRDFPLVIAANRDEFHARPADPMGWWQEQPTLLAGRDLRAGGTWLGLSRQGRIATVTNFRDDVPGVAEQSRGEIVTRYAASSDAPAEFLDSLPGERYAGFSALACDGRELAYRSNRGEATRILDSGIYGLGNASLDTPWPKIVRSRRRLLDMMLSGNVTVDALFDLAGDRSPARARESPESGLPFELDGASSAPFIVMPDFGTRCSTAIVCRADGHIEVAERRFDTAGDLTGESRFVFIARNWLPQSTP